MKTKGKALKEIKTLVNKQQLNKAETNTLALFEAKSSEDLLALAKKYIPRSVILEAARFSWEVQHDSVPEDVYVPEGWRSNKGLAELFWNDETKEWLLEETEKLTARTPNVNPGTVLSHLAKAIAIAVIYEPTPEDEEFQGWDEDEELQGWDEDEELQGWDEA